MEIVELDPSDEAAFADWFTVCEEADRYDRPNEPSWMLQEQRALSIAGAGAGAGPNPDVWMLLLAARRDGRTVGAARLEVPQRDNAHLVELTFAVHPEARRRGVARALDDEVVGRTRALGRSTLMTYGDEPPGTEGRSGNRLAAQALGYDVVQTEVRRDIRLPLDLACVAQVEQQVAEQAHVYDVFTWWDRCPQEHLEGMARLHQAMSTDVPKDQMDWREELWDGARVRRDEDLFLAMDRTAVGGGAVHRDSGEVAAFTRMGVARADRRRAYQWETLVLSSHRGRRLGMQVKLAALQELAAGSPQTEFISTWNARENGPMIAVNDALGSRVNGGLVILQKVV